MDKCTHGEAKRRSSVANGDCPICLLGRIQELEREVLQALGFANAWTVENGPDADCAGLLPAWEAAQ